MVYPKKQKFWPCGGEFSILERAAFCWDFSWLLAAILFIVCSQIDVVTATGLWDCRAVCVNTMTGRLHLDTLHYEHTLAATRKGELF